MANAFGMTEKSFSKRFYSCLLIPLIFQILFLYYISGLLFLIVPIFLYIAMLHLVFQIGLSRASIEMGIWSIKISVSSF